VVVARLAPRSGNGQLSTLERYIGALGGKLEIHAVFDDDIVKLTPDFVISPPQSPSRRESLSA
jgi:hypothetical protein